MSLDIWQLHVQLCSSDWSSHHVICLQHWVMNDVSRRSLLYIVVHKEHIMYFGKQAHFSSAESCTVIGRLCQLNC